MSSEKISIRYAQSIFDLASEKKMLDQVKGDMQLILDSIKGSADLHIAIKSPLIKADKKQAILKAIFGGKISEMTQSFLNVLTVKGREPYTLEVCESFMHLYNQKNNIVPVVLRTAVAVSDDVKKAIQSSIKGNVQLETIIDPSLIGGFVVEYDNKMMDSSVARSLENLKQKFN